jgi:hypothetical protein
LLNTIPGVIFPPINLPSLVSFTARFSSAACLASMNRGIPPTTSKSSVSLHLQTAHLYPCVPSYDGVCMGVDPSTRFLWLVLLITVTSRAGNVTRLVHSGVGSGQGALIIVIGSSIVPPSCQMCRLVTVGLWRVRKATPNIHK